MSKHKKYELTTLQQIVDLVTDENFENFAMDFLTWLDASKQMANNYREKYPEETKGKLNSEIFKSTFIWIDDGKCGLKEFVLKNTTTGEIKVKKHKK